jgi:hypothetical protein
MARIVAGLFEDQVAADKAAMQLLEHDVPASEVTKFVVNPPGMHATYPVGGDEAADQEARGGEEGAVRGAAIGGAIGVVAGLAAAPLVGPVGMAGTVGAGAFVGALAGAASAMGDERDVATARPGGVMVAVRADTVDEHEVIDAMRECGATLIEIEEGEWRDGDWVDFDPVRPPRNIVELKGGPNYPT